MTIPTNKLRINCDPIIMKPMKNKTEYCLESRLGYKPIPLESTPEYMTVNQPSPVIISNSVIIAEEILSKLALEFCQTPPLCRQSAFVSTNYSMISFGMSMHRKNYPLKKLMPMIAKIIRKRVQTMITFVIAGIEDNRALTTSLRPSFLLMTLSGLKALSALRAFRDLRAPPAD